jgi:hypothetical protein
VNTWPMSGLDITISGGRIAEADTPSVRAWTVDATLSRDQVDIDHAHVDEDAFDHDREVARMWLYAVNPEDGDPLADLDSISADCGDLGAAIWRGGAVRTAFAAATGTVSGEPVLLVDNFTVADRWRGTVFTPALAALMLEPFAALGATTAALYACPAGAGRMSDIRRAAIQRRIASMWAHLGFRPFTEYGCLAMPLTTQGMTGMIEQASETIPALKYR